MNKTRILAKIILGLDPGTLLMGFGIVQVINDKFKLIEFGEIYLKDILDPYERLNLIYQKTSNLILEFMPDECAIEAPFFGKNVQSMLKLGRAQGVAIAAVTHNNLKITEYAPKEIKQSITGKGTSTKLQVWEMLKRLMDIQFEPKYFDGSDALAVAVCHHFKTSNGLNLKSNKKGWDDFIKNNADRVKF